MTERLKRAVIYSIALGLRFFKWKMRSLSGSKALLFLQLLIALVPMAAVNDNNKDSETLIHKVVGLGCDGAT